MRKSKILSRNVKLVEKYFRKKGVKEGWIFGSALRKVSPKHDIDVALPLKPTPKNLKRFEDATQKGIDVFLLERGGTLFSVGLGDVLYEDSGLPQDIFHVNAKKVTFGKRKKQVKLL